LIYREINGNFIYNINILIIHQKKQKFGYLKNYPYLYGMKKIYENIGADIPPLSEFIPSVPEGGEMRKKNTRLISI